jgi:hypothetical protein
MTSILKAGGVALLSVGCVLAGLAVWLWFKGVLTVRYGLIIDLPGQSRIMRVPLGYVAVMLVVFIALGVLMLLAAARRH